MKQIVVNEVPLTIYSYQDFVDMNNSGLVFDQTSIYHKEREWLAVPLGMPNNNRVLIQLAGHDERKIDYAIPESFFDEYYKQYGEKPKAFFTYEHSGFGEPLFVNDLIIEAIQNIEEVLNGLRE